MEKKSFVFVSSVFIGLLIFALPVMSQAQSAQPIGYIQRGSEEPTTLSMTADVLVARPLLIGATVLGTALFAVSLPFSILGNNVPESAEKLVAKPARAACLRCLGCRYG
jgi:hypothetical protein